MVLNYFGVTLDAVHRSQISISLKYVHKKRVLEDYIPFVDWYEPIWSDDIEGEEPHLPGKVKTHCHWFL